MENINLVDDAGAAEILGVSKGTLPVWRSTGRYSIPYIKVGRNVRYKVSDLMRWLESRTTTKSNRTKSPDCKFAVTEEE